MFDNVIIWTPESIVKMFLLGLVVLGVLICGVLIGAAIVIDKLKRLIDRIAGR